MDLNKFSRRMRSRLLLSVILLSATVVAIGLGNLQAAGWLAIAEAAIAILGIGVEKVYTTKYKKDNLVWNLACGAIGVGLVVGVASDVLAVVAVIHAVGFVGLWMINAASRIFVKTMLRRSTHPEIREMASAHAEMALPAGVAAAWRKGWIRDEYIVGSVFSSAEEL